MNRRDFIRLAGAGLGAAALPGIASGSPAPAGRRPNIVFIMADDLAIGDLGCYGQQRIRTPQMDRLAEQGTRFTNCYSGSPVCAPARCVLMTGQHTGHCRVRANSAQVGGVVEYFGQGGHRLSITDDDRTVAEALRDSGYATGAMGKWGLAEPGTAGTPNRRGFDEWFGYLNQNHAAYYYTDHLWRNEEKQHIPENAGGREEVYSHDLLTEEALSFVRRNRDNPFFLYLPYTIPHKRFEVPSLGEYADKPWHEEAKIYAAMVSRMDRDIGRLMDELDRLGLADNTVVFLTSDNGEINNLPWPDDLFNASLHLRGKKASLYEGGIRVPMIVRWPGKTPVGHVSDAPWWFADVFPTLANIAGAPTPSGIDGIDVTGLLRGEAPPSERSLYWEFPRSRLWQAARLGRWKGLRFGTDQPLELYDLAADEGETRNVAARYPEITAELAEFMTANHVPSPHWPVN